MIDTKKIAFKYFNGESTYSEEKTLNAFIRAKESNYALFTEWESEWSSQTAHNLKIEHFFNKVSDRIYNLKIKRLYKFALTTISAASIIILVTSLILNSLKEEEFIQIQAPHKMRTKVVLADGTKVWLNSASKISYSNEFSKDRLITLEGEAYFDVTHNKKNPFRVQLNHGIITVLGTKFNICNYNSDTTMSTTLFEGGISFRSNEGKEYILKPGDILISEPSSVKIMNEQNINSHRSWIDGKLDFDSIRLDKLLDRLSVQFGVDIHYNFDHLHDREFRIYLTNSESISEILNALASIVPISYHFDKDDIYIEETIK